MLQLIQYSVKNLVSCPLSFSLFNYIGILTSALRLEKVNLKKWKKILKVFASNVLEYVNLKRYKGTKTTCKNVSCVLATKKYKIKLEKYF